MATSDDRPAKRARLDLFDSVEVLVGEEEQKCTVYKTVIMKHSPFFRAALTHDCKEREEQRVRLPECKPDTFNDYLHWLKDCEIPTVCPPECPFHSTETCRDEMHRLVELFVLADQLRDIALCNAIIDEINKDFCYMWTLPHAETFMLVYELVPETSPLRTLLLDCFNNYGHCGRCQELCQVRGCDEQPCHHKPASPPPCVPMAWLVQHKDHLPLDFIVDVAKAGQMREHRWPAAPDECTTADNENVEGAGPCYYHEHNEEVPPYTGGQKE